MKSILLCFAVAALLSCNDTVSIDSAKVDSLKMEADTLAGKIEQKVEQAYDTTKEKARELKNKIGDRLDSDKRKDSTVIKIDH